MRETSPALYFSVIHFLCSLFFPRTKVFQRVCSSKANNWHVSGVCILFEIIKTIYLFSSVCFSCLERSSVEPDNPWLSVMNDLYRSMLGSMPVDELIWLQIFRHFGHLKPTDSLVCWIIRLFALALKWCGFHRCYCIIGYKLLDFFFCFRQIFRAVVFSLTNFHRVFLKFWLFAVSFKSLPGSKINGYLFPCCEINLICITSTLLKLLGFFPKAQDTLATAVIVSWYLSLSSIVTFSL